MSPTFYWRRLAVAFFIFSVLGDITFVEPAYQMTHSRINDYGSKITRRAADLFSPIGVPCLFMCYWN